MEPVQDHSYSEAAIATETINPLRDRAVESFISLREDIPPKSPFPNTEDPFKEQRERTERIIEEAVESGITPDNIQEEAELKKKDDILKAHIEHEKLFYDTDGFALGKLTPEQITRKAALEDITKTAQVWDIDLDEIQKGAEPEIEQYASQKKAAELKAAQQANLDMWKMCDEVVLNGGSIHNLSPENRQTVEKARGLASRVGFGQHPASTDEIEAETSRYRQRERPAFLERARQVSQEIQSLQKSLGTESTVFRLGDITQSQLDQIHRINSFIFYTRVHYHISAGELGVKYFGTLGVHEAYQGAKLKNS